MKPLARTLVASALGLLSQLIVRKYRPIVVMVTGSVGKTSTKDAVAAALGARYFVRASEKSYNSEFGVPLTIIGARNPWTNPLKWMKVFLDGIELLVLPSHYPKLLVLEVGADRPGDLSRILRFITPDVVVVTRLPEVPVHVEAYASPQAVRDEEFAPAYALPSGAPLIISADDPYAASMAAKLEVEIITYGLAEGATVKLGAPAVLIEDGEAAGMHSPVRVGGADFDLKVHGALGRQQLFAPAAALGAALALHLEPHEALEGLEAYVPPPGRSRILKGKNGSLLIDDSYNASPAAVEEALKALSFVSAKRRIAVLGDMLELGRYSLTEHARIGELAAKSADVIVSVGMRAKATADAARGAGTSDEHVFSFDTSYDAAKALTDMVGEGDIVLIKGSQSIRTERVVEALLRHKEDKDRLVRQDKEWRKR